MADTTNNLGAQVRIAIYVEGAKVARDFSDVVSFSDDDQFYEGDDEHLGDSDVTHWLRYKNTVLNFQIHQSNASYVEKLKDALRAASLNGQKPKVTIAKYTTNTDESSSKASWSKCTLKAKFTAGGKGEKNVYDWVAVGTADQTE